MAMGGWYIAKFLGSLLAGLMGAYWLVIPPSAFFSLGMVSTLVAAASLYAMARMLSWKCREKAGARLRDSIPRSHHYEGE
jgi:hypothetical protein